ncbi:MAG: hypothetical protein IJ459_03170 [Clostridia bacterium]|nr:hypothetical protein [Clostridia bacterium]
MKKNKRIFSALATALFVAAIALSLIGFSAFAATESDPTPTVMSKNVSYGSELYLYYAVPASSIPEGETPSLGVYSSNGTTLKYTVTEYSVETVWGESCYIFRTRGVAPKGLNTVEYVRAQSSGGARGELVSYSVEQYLFDKLYSEGYALMSSSDGKNYVRRNLYYDLLKYGKTAQKLLSSQALEQGAVKPIGEVTYLGVAGGSYVGFSEEGDTATLNYVGTPPAGREFSGFRVSSFDPEGKLISSYDAMDGDTVTVSGIMCAYPIYVLKSYETLIDSGSKVAILAENDDALYAAESLRDAIAAIVGEMGIVDVNPNTGTGYADVIIVISNGDDAPSSGAALAAIPSDSTFREARFAAHAYDGRIEISYDTNEYTTIQVLPYAMAEYIKEYFSADSAHFEANAVYTRVIDLVEKQEALDELLVAEQWANLEAEAVALYGETNGKAITEALKGYYALFKDEAVDWYANLYDPGIGGYYVTTSGKTYLGYLPTLESTRQALDFILTSGMIKLLGSNWTKVLPETMKAQVIYYTLSLQNENGYFYNPQLTKAETDNQVSRRGRDLSWGIRILSAAGVSPIYPTPTGGEGQTTLGMTPDEWWASTGIDESYKPRVPTSLNEYESWITTTVSESTVSAVSKAILTATDDSTAYLESYSAFAAYLDSKDIDASPYSVGNELNATYSQIKAYGERLHEAEGVCPAGITSAEGINYSGMTMQEMLLAWIEAHINDNGLFGDDGDGVADDYLFQNTNGFFKIISIYTNWGIAYPKPVEATQGLLNCLRSDEKTTTNICEVYNAWSALSSLQKNVIELASAEDKATVLANITSYIGQYGEEAIDKTTEKQSGYQKADGTFSHKYVGSVVAHQGGIPVGTGADEGNVDAMGFGINGTVDSIRGVLGLKTDVYKYTESDFMRYLDIILHLEPVAAKQEYVADANSSVTDFESFDYSEYAGITEISSASASNSYAVEIEDEEADVINHVLAFNKSVNGSGTNLGVKQYCSASESNADVAVLEFRFKAINLSSRLELQITLGGSSASPVVILGYTPSGVYANGTRIYIGDTSHYTSARIGEWITFRIEYRVTAIDSDGTVTGIECRTYVNDTLANTVTTIRSGKTAPTVASAQYFSISVNNSNKGSFYFDDISFVKKKSVG